MERKSCIDVGKKHQLLETVDTLQKEKDCWYQIESHAQALRKKTENMSQEQKEQNEQETEKILFACQKQLERLDKLIDICIHNLDGCSS